MPKLLKALTAAGVAALSVFVVAPGAVHAGAGAAAVPSIMSPLVVGETGTAQIVIENRNENLPGEPFDFELATNVVCNEVNPAGTNCAAGTEGVTYTPACGATGNFSVCSQPDPDVLSLQATATGIDGTCVGMVFDVTAIGDVLGRYLFTPQSLGQIMLPGRAARCVIEFTYFVEKLPDVDADPNLPGMQTIAITDHTQSVVGTVNSASARGQSFPITVNKATPLLNTVASPDVPLGGGQLTDTAVVSGLVLPDGTGTVSFSLYGPDDPTCAGPPVFVDLDNVYTGPSLTSDPYDPTATGTYRWVASYSGDSANDSVTGTCGDPNEQTDVSPAKPTIVTTASADVLIGGELTDTATVNGRVSPLAGATVDFRLYGPDDATCAGAPVFESLGVDYPIAGGAVTSTGFTPTSPGTYRWIASYSGDANNEAATGVCGDPDETSAVSLNTPVIVTTASANTFVGDGKTLTDTATVTGRVAPVAGATVDFRLYGPNDALCSGSPIFESLGVAYPVAGGPVTSAAFSPTIAGTYRWVATYSGDANNASVAGVCGDPTETTQVGSTPDLTGLPETGPGHLRPVLTIGVASLLLGVALLGSASRRRQFPMSQLR